MAFDFLDDLKGIANKAAPLIEFGGGIAEMFRKNNNPALNAGMGATNASIDPNSPQFRNLAALFEEKARQDALQMVNTIMSQDQRAKARGAGTGIVNPERRDETRSSVLTRAFQEAGAQGRGQARTALTGAAPQYAQYQPSYEDRNARQANQRGAAVEGLADLFRSFKVPESQPKTKPVIHNSDYWGR